MVIAGVGGDARGWEEEAYRSYIREEMASKARTVFASIFAPLPLSPDLLATASSHGSIHLYSLSSCISHQQASLDQKKHQMVAEPILTFSGHDGPAYDLKFFGDGDNALLLSCGDDGKIQGWHWRNIMEAVHDSSKKWENLEPAFNLRNPQQRGPRGALCQVPETNAICVDEKEGCIYSANGNGVAYKWDIETGRMTMSFEGHDDYLHCICSRPSHNQVVTGSEDGTARIWDCRSGSCIAILDPCKAIKISKCSRNKSAWVSCVAIDASENWLASGSGGNCITLWSLPASDAVMRIVTSAAPQALVVTKDQIVSVGAQPLLSCYGFGGNVLSQVSVASPSVFSAAVHPSGTIAVGGYGGLVDVVSQFGSHICTFRCK